MKTLAKKEEKKCIGNRRKKKLGKRGKSRKKRGERRKGKKKGGKAEKKRKSIKYW